MASFIFLLSCVIIVNICCLLMIWSSHLSDEVKPKFIASSYDPNATIDFDSMVLKSLNKLISKYFKEPSIISKHVGDLPIGNISDNQSFLNDSYYQFKPDFHSKYFLLFNEDHSHLRILQIAKDIPSESKYNSKFNEISLYTVSTHNFMINYKSDYNLSKSMIQQCWSSKFPGKIIGATSSNDKRSIAIVYRVIKGNVITNRIRYIDNLSCEDNKSQLFNQQDTILFKEFKDYLHFSSNGNFTLNDEGDLRNEDKFNTFLMSNETYDDFALQGNSPLTSLAVKKDTIAFTRDLDFHAFYVIKRNMSKHEWSVSIHGPEANSTNYHYYHTNSIKFAPDDHINDVKLIQIYLTINSSSINILCDIIKANYTSDTFKIAQSIKSQINEEIMNTKSLRFDLEEAIRNLKKYAKPTVYSNGNTNNFIMEIIYGTICYLGWDDKNNENLYMISNTEEKVEKISIDNLNENIVLKYDNGDFIYIHRRNNTDEYDYYDDAKLILFNSLPKKFRGKKPISFLIEKFDNRIILFMLMHEGIVLSLDFTKIVEKENWQLWSQIFNDYNYTVILIMFGNVISVVIYFKMFRNRRIITDANQRVSQEVNQVMRDLNMVNANEVLRPRDNLNNPAPQNNPLVNINEINVIEQAIIQQHVIEQAIIQQQINEQNPQHNQPNNANQINNNQQPEAQQDHNEDEPLIEDLI